MPSAMQFSDVVVRWRGVTPHFEACQTQTRIGSPISPDQPGGAGARPLTLGTSATITRRPSIVCMNSTPQRQGKAPNRHTPPLNTAKPRHIRLTPSSTSKPRNLDEHPRRLPPSGPRRGLHVGCQSTCRAPRQRRRGSETVTQHNDITAKTSTSNRRARVGLVAALPNTVTHKGIGVTRSRTSVTLPSKTDTPPKPIVTKPA